MKPRYHARWVSKEKSDALKRSGALAEAVLLDSFKGFIVVEPAGRHLGDGGVLSPVEADFELTPVWCLTPKKKLEAARRMLGLKTMPGMSPGEEPI
jgi:hypothetical protein